MNVELVFYNRAKLLEGPQYIKEENALLFVSIKDCSVNLLHLDDGFIESVRTDGAVGCAVYTGNGNVMSAEKSGIYKVNMASGKKELFCHPNRDKRMRYNDGKADPSGRFVVGTMGEEKRYPGESAVYSVEKDASFKTIITGTTISNGLGWNSDGSKMYFIDTPTKKVMVYDYDLKTGSVSKGRTLVEITDDGASPDGMCVDIDGNIWVAEWGGGKVCKFDSGSGKKLAEIPIPATNVSSCCVGGMNNEYLYVTTAVLPEKEEPLAGGLFRVRIR